MARKIKRLSYRSDPSSPFIERLIKRDPPAWQKELSWWSGVGINTVLLMTLLERARVGRRLFEDRLEARIDPHTTWRIRDARRGLKDAGPLIRLLKTERSVDGPPELVFGDLGAQVERALQRYIDTLRRPALAAHHPGEPWFRKPVLLLTRLLRARGQSWNGTEGAIRELFELAGQRDVATAERIRYYIRAERRRDPKFGVAYPTDLSAWFAKSESVVDLDLYPSEATASERRRSRGPRPRRRSSAPVRKKRR